MTKRTEQIGDSILQILSEVIHYEVKDPRVGFATVVSVQVSGDLHHARVQISVMGDETQRKETMAGLERAKGFLRRRVAQELRHLRTTPELHFMLDTSLDYSMHIDDVLRKVAEERKQNPPTIDTDTDRKEPG